MHRLARVSTIGLVGAAMMLTGCPDGPVFSPTQAGSGAFFAYVRNDQQYKTWLCIFNQSKYWTPAEIEYADEQGNVVANEPLLLQPFQSYRVSKPGFTGSVLVRGTGEPHAIQATIEIHDTTTSALALAQPGGNDYVWYFHLGAEDEGPGQVRSTIVTTNLDFHDPVYAEYGLLRPYACAASFEVEIAPRGMHAFRPYDEFADIAADELSSAFLYVGGNDAPDSSGAQVRSLRGATFVEADGDIALANVPVVNRGWWSMGGTNYDQASHLYFADVQDNGASRQDRIYIKSNLATTYPHPTSAYNIHFYDESGVEILTPHPPLSLVDMFDDVDSCAVLKPMEDFTGTPFKGSVWVESPHEWLDGLVRRRSPGKWTDMSNAAPAGSMLEGIIPFVSSKLPDRHYQIVLFYPINIHPVPQQLETPPPAMTLLTFTPPTQPKPVAKDGVVVLTLRDTGGSLKGYLSVDVAANQTKYVRVDDIASKYLEEPFEGSIQFDPHVVVTLQIWNDAETCHGSTGVWDGAQ